MPPHFVAALLHFVAAMLLYLRKSSAFSVKGRQILAAPPPDTKPQAHPIEMQR